MLNSLPKSNGKILNMTNLKTFADDKSNVTQNIIYVFNRVENIVKKEKNASYQHFLLFPQHLQKLSLSGLTLSQTTNFRLFQTERVCRQQFQI